MVAELCGITAIMVTNIDMIVVGVSANRLHGFGRFNLQNTACRGGSRCRSSAEHLGRLEEEGWGDRQPEGLGGLQ